jgi:hypothetical protein
MLHFTVELPLFFFLQKKVTAKTAFFGKSKRPTYLHPTNYARFLPLGIQRPYTYRLSL